jgi:hypothetical protein
MEKIEDTLELEIEDRGFDESDFYNSVAYGNRREISDYTDLCWRVLKKAPDTFIILSIMCGFFFGLPIATLLDIYIIDFNDTQYVALSGFIGILSVLPISLLFFKWNLSNYSNVYIFSDSNMYYIIDDFGTYSCHTIFDLDLVNNIHLEDEAVKLSFEDNDFVLSEGDEIFEEIQDRVYGLN